MARRIALSEGEVKRILGEDHVHRFSQIHTDGRAKRGGADWGEEKRDATLPTARKKHLTTDATDSTDGEKARSGFQAQGLSYPCHP